jgi:hypothetical protein
MTTNEHEEPGYWEHFMAPRDPAWTEPNDKQLSTLRTRVHDAAVDLAAHISVRQEQLQRKTPTREQAMTTADWHLSVVRALRETLTLAEGIAENYARKAGAAGASYAQLGTAWGVSRQAARKRWPGAVSAINPHANREPVHFEAFGGEARVVFHPEDGGWWWIATAANRQVREAPEKAEYDTSEEAAAAAGAFLAANATTTEEPNR